MGLSVSAPEVDIMNRKNLLKKKKKKRRLAGIEATFHFKPSDSERPALHTTGAHTSKWSGGKFCSVYSTPLQKKACLVTHSGKPGTKGPGARPQH